MLRKAVCVAGMLCLIGANWAPAEPATAVLPVTADVGISSVRGKMRYSNALGPSTVIRQNQNWSGFEAKTLLMAFDAEAIKGWTVSQAHLNLYVAKGDFYGLGLCTVLAPWEEGRTLNWTERAGSPCWDFVRCPEPGAEPGADNWWAWPGSAIYSVSWAHPSARYSHAGPRDLVRGKTEDGRFVHLQVPVDPALVESLAIGACYGLILTDDKGQVTESYSLIGPAYPYRYNEAEDCWVFTNDIQEKTLRPTLEVRGEPTDQTPPTAPTDVKVAERNPGDGTIVVTFVAPGDDGATGTALAYEAVYSKQELSDANWDQAQPLPRWSLPLPVEGGKLQRMPVFTLAQGKYQLAVRAVDEAGHRGPCATLAVDVPAVTKRPLAKAPAAEPAAGAQQPVADAADKLTVFACPDMVKVDPVSGAALADGDEYRADAELAVSNTVWRAGDRRVSLRAAANEVAAFKLLLGKSEASLTNVQVAVDDLVGSGGNKIAAKPNAQLFRLWYVWTGREPPEAVGPGELDDATIRPSAWHGDACLPLAEPFDTSFDLPAADNNVPGQRYQAVWVDVYVPGGTAAGDYEGTIRISADQLAEPLELRLAVEVLPFSLPDRPSWVVELNRYHSVVGWAGVDAKADPQQALETTWDYYALGHQHRCELNALPYSHSGRIDTDYIPTMTGKGADTRVADWSEWDQRFGPLLDGSAFSAERGYVGPCANTPITQMYMAFHEAWPIFPVKDYYEDYMDVSTRIEFAEYAKQAGRVADAFKPEYKEGFVSVVRQFFEHFNEKRWTETAFQFYYNNKYYWKVAYFGGMGRGGISFWLMDEPTDFDDYDANRFLLALARQGYEAANAPKTQVHYRTDVSQPEMHRTLWDNVCNLWNCSAMMHFGPTAHARQRWITDEYYWRYGGGPGASAPPVAMHQRLLSSWALGTTGDLPYWDTFRGRGRAWRQADNLAVFYSGKDYCGSGKDYAGPIAGVRLKVMRRCQQDIEYLHLLAGRHGWDRPTVTRTLAEYCDNPDEPVWTFGKLTLRQVQELRDRVTETILGSKKPASM